MVCDRQSIKPTATRQRFVSTWPQIWSNSVEISVECPNASATLIAPPYPTTTILFDLFWIIGIILLGIIFGECLFDNEINNEKENEKFEFGNLNNEFVNVFGNDKCDNFCKALLCSIPPPNPAPRLPAVEFDYSRVLLREQLVLECEYDVGFCKNEYDNEICNGMSFFGDFFIFS